MQAIVDVDRQLVTDTEPGVFLVGGAVRDVLLGRGELRRRLASRATRSRSHVRSRSLWRRFTPHAKFGTAIVQYGDSERIDVVTTRRERYDSARCSSDRRAAEIADDLHRRDFTINAMAVSLQPADFGRSVDPFGGREDLEHGVDPRAPRPVVRRRSHAHPAGRPVRVPLRIPPRRPLRALARAVHRRRSRRGGLAGHAYATSSYRCSTTPERRAAIVRLGELGADRALHPGLRGDAEGAALFVRAVGLRDELATRGAGVADRAGRPRSRLTADEAFGWLDGLDIKRRDVDLIVGAIAFAPQIVERLRDERPSTPAGIVGLADPFAPDAPLLALALADGPELRDYFEPPRGRRARDRRLASSPSSGSRSRRGWGRCSPSSGAASSTASSTAATRSSRPRGSSSAGAIRDRRVRERRSRSAIARIREEVGPGVTVVAATKYVSVSRARGARGGRRRGRGREPRPGSRAEARRVRRRVPLALHRAPAVEQGKGRERDLRARALALLGVGSAPG